MLSLWYVLKPWVELYLTGYHCCTGSTLLHFTVYIMPWHFWNTNKNEKDQVINKMIDQISVISKFPSRSVKINYKIQSMKFFAIRSFRAKSV